MRHQHLVKKSNCDKDSTVIAEVPNLKISHRASGYQVLNRTTTLMDEIVNAWRTAVWYNIKVEPQLNHWKKWNPHGRCSARSRYRPNQRYRWNCLVTPAAAALNWQETVQRAAHVLCFGRTCSSIAQCRRKWDSLLSDRRKNASWNRPNGNGRMGQHDWSISSTSKVSRSAYKMQDL